MTSEAIAEDLLEELSSSWRQASAPQFRLHFMRETARKLHAEKSRILAVSDRESDDSTIDDLERALEQMRDSELYCLPTFEEALDEISSKGDSRVSMLPPGFPGALRDKLQQYDRKWELALAEQACRAGWYFFTLHCWLPMSKIEQETTRLMESTFPFALWLITESAAFDGTGQDQKSLFWQPSFTFTAEPRLVAETRKRAEKILSQSALISTPEAPRWAHLFPPDAKTDMLKA